MCTSLSGMQFLTILTVCQHHCRGSPTSQKPATRLAHISTVISRLIHRKISVEKIAYTPFVHETQGHFVFWQQLLIGQIDHHPASAGGSKAAGEHFPHATVWVPLINLTRVFFFLVKNNTTLMFNELHHHPSLSFQPLRHAQWPNRGPKPQTHSWTMAWPCWTARPHKPACSGGLKKCDHKAQGPWSISSEGIECEYEAQYYMNLRGKLRDVPSHEIMYNYLSFSVSGGD